MKKYKIIFDVVSTITIKAESMTIDPAYGVYFYVDDKVVAYFPQSRYDGVIQIDNIVSTTTV